MLVTAAAFAAAGVNEIFDYNRKSYKFDREQQLEREELRLRMQIKRFELFREDIRDLVRLTVDRMDIYHVVGALFLQFCIVILTKGRIQAAAPPFLLSLFLLTAACAFIYLLLAVWMSVHASIASHSFGTKLLTRFVRLPIPSLRQIRDLTFHLKEFENQGIGDILRLPFQQGATERVEQQTHDQAEEEARRRQRQQMHFDLEMERIVEREVDDDGEADDGDAAGDSMANAVEAAVAAVEDTGGAAAARNSHHAYDEREMLLPQEDVEPIMGGDDLLASKTGARPDRHIQLFRILQAKWQCYDAYCRVCMSLGVNQMLQVLSYYAIAHSVVENVSPTTGLALVFMFQCCTVALGVFDLAGLRRREIIAVQLVGVLPCILTAVGMARGTRNEKGELDTAEYYSFSPFSFLLTALWLELWLRISSPSRDRARLPRRFRQVLFLDVFGDAGSEDPSAAEERQMREGFCRPPAEIQAEDDEHERATALVAEEALRRATSQFALALAAVRRWRAAPAWALSKPQRRELESLTERLTMWGTTVRLEFDKCMSKMPTLVEDQRPPVPPMDVDLRPWENMTEEERADDPFVGCLVGPFKGGPEGQGTFHFDVESGTRLALEEAARERPDAVVLTMAACAQLLHQLEHDARRVLEVRICYDLRCETRRQRRQREASAGLASTFPTLVELVQDGGTIRLRRNSPDGASGQSLPPPPAPLPRSDRSTRQTQSPPTRQAQSSSPPMAMGATVSGRGDAASDPTFAAVAGKHARHFVPERLPWQLVSRMTRVLQLCWFWAFLMASLKETAIFTIDFGMGGLEINISEAPGEGIVSGEALANEVRRLSASEEWRFESVQLVGPPPELFRPRGLACSVGEAGGELLVASAFSVHSAGRGQGGLGECGGCSTEPWQLREIARSRLHNSSTVVCFALDAAAAAPTATAAATCIGVAASARGLRLWRVGRGQGEEPLVLPFRGAPWRLVSGAAMPCRAVAKLLPPAAAPADRCLLFAGFDGTSFPLLALPFANASAASGQPAGSTGAGAAAPADASLLLAEGTAAVMPAAAVPVLADSPPPAALHVDGLGGRLWVVWASGELEAWDLLRARSLGRWRPRWPGAQAPASVAVCAAAASSGGPPWLFALMGGDRNGRRSPAAVARAPLPTRLQRFSAVEAA